MIPGGGARSHIPQLRAHMQQRRAYMPQLTPGTVKLMNKEEQKQGPPWWHIG